MDSKPEKGERKLADDLIILINEILSPYYHRKIDHVVLYRMGILEYALSISPYNFDIQMQLLKLYDSLGLSISLKQAFGSLNPKGVQLESMGYIVYRHAIDWGDYKLMEMFEQKYGKYFKMNIRDLKQIKLKALNEDNYD